MFLPSNSDRSRCEDSCSDGQGKDVAKMLMFAATLTFLHIATQVTRIGLVTGPTWVATCGLTSSMQKVWQGRGFSTLPMNQVDIPFNILLAYGETSEDVYIQDSEPELRFHLLCFCWSKHFFVPKLVHQERHEEIHTRRTQPGAPLSKACAWGLEEQVECTLKLTMQKVFLLTQDIWHMTV